MNIINFINYIKKNRRRIKGEQNLKYILTIQKKIDAFDILNDISENVTLVQLIDSLVNVNHAISEYLNPTVRDQFFDTRIIEYNMISFYWRRTNCNFSIRILCC